MIHANIPTGGTYESMRNATHAGARILAINYLQHYVITRRVLRQGQKLHQRDTTQQEYSLENIVAGLQSESNVKRNSMVKKKNRRQYPQKKKREVRSTSSSY